MNDSVAVVGGPPSFLDLVRQAVLIVQLFNVQAVNGEGKRVPKYAMVRGKKQSLTVVRIVFHLEGDTPWPPDLAGLVTKSQPPSKGSSKKGKAASASAQTPGASAAGPASPEELAVPGATKVLVEEVAAVRSSCFEFKALKHPIKASGRYGLHQLAPDDTIDCATGTAVCLPVHAIACVHSHSRKDI